MLTLCLDTTTGPCSIAISRDGQTVAASLLNAPGKHQNAWLLPELERLLAACGLDLAQIDLFACASGPGSFTGVRTGVATIQGLALAHAKPCVGISSLALLAMQLPYAQHPVCPLLDARKNEVYAGLYSCRPLPTPLQDDCTLPPAEFLKQLSGPVIFLGDGAIRYRQLIDELLGDKALFAPPSHAIPLACHGAPLAEAAFRNGQALSAEQLLPSYLRLSEAEISRQKLRGA
jgi:tRNA threonylcarbamoyladenosine biosynthesis protein TsaB